MKKRDSSPGRIKSAGGSLIAGWDGWRYHLYWLAVRPDRRRQGIGRALLVAAEQRFTALGEVPAGRRSWTMIALEM